MESFNKNLQCCVAQTWRKRGAMPFLVAPFVLLALLVSGAACAQTVTNYSYDQLQRLTGATIGSSSIQYTYDADGNLTSITRTSSSSISANQPLDVNLDVPGQSASFTFSLTGDGNAEIDLNSISTSPPGSSVSIAVYNSSGALIASTSGTTDVSLALSGLPAGTYTVVLTPPSSATASLQVDLSVAAAPDLGGAPLPPWCYLLLGAGLLAALARFQRRSAGLRALCLAIFAVSAGTAAHAQGLPGTPIGTIGAEVYWTNEGGPPYFSSALAACTYISDNANHVEYPIDWYENPRAEYKPDYGWGCEFDLLGVSGGGWSYNVYFQGWTGPVLLCPPGYSGPTNTSAAPIAYGTCEATSAPNPWFPQKNECGVGDPVFPCAGVQFEDAVDIPRLSSGLELTRHYLSGSGNGSSPNAAAVFGAGWSFRYGAALSFSVNSSGAINTVFAARPDGTGAIFVPNGSGGWVSKADTDDVLSATTDDSGNVTGWDYFDAATNATEQYDTTGKLISVTDRGGIVLQMTYSTSSTPSSVTIHENQLIEVSDPFGRSISFTYNGAGLIASATDPAGNVVSYSYNSSGILTSVTYPDSTSLTYEYNESQYMGGGNSARALTGITDQSGNRYAIFNYNSSDEVIGTQLAGGVNQVALSLGTNQSTVTDALGGTRAYASEVILGISRPTSITQSCGSGCNTATATITYDANGNVASKTDLDGNLTCYAYDPTRNVETARVEGFSPGSSCPADLASYTPASGTTQRVITTTWDSTYRLPEQITEANRTTSFTYDGGGDLLTKTVIDTSISPNVSRTWTYTYNGYGRVLTAKGPRTDVNGTTTYSYYSCTNGAQCGELETITDALGHVTTYNTYDGDGRPLTITDPNGVVTTLAYDTRGHLLLASAGGETTSFSYYPTGLLEQVTLPDGSDLVYTYDTAHRLTQVSDGLGDKIVYTLDAVGNRTAENSYDPSGTLFRTHTRVINELNEIYEEVNAAGTPEVTTTFGYDSEGNQTSIAGPLNHDTSESYDPLNRLIQINDPAGGVTAFGYDAQDDLTSVTDPRTLATSYSYNGFGDLTTRVSPDSGTTGETYDSGGDIATSTDARGAVAAYSYDALNRITAISYSSGGSSDQALSFTYDQGTDGIGHLTGASDANHSMSWSHDPQGRVTQMTQTVSGISKTVQYSYTNGDLASLTTPSGRSIGYQYSDHQITAITVNGTQVVSGVTYAPFGPVTGWQWGGGASVSRAYNGDGQVTSSTSGGYAASYTYYDDGTLESATENAPAVYSTSSGTTSVSIAGTSNQISSLSGAASGSYQYDAAGNVLNDGTRTFTYNDAGRLATATDGGVTTTYRYNALGERIEKSNSNGTTYFVYDEAGHLLGEYDASGNLIEELVWLNDVPVASLRPNPGGSGIEILYIQTDFLNAPTELTSATTGKMLWSWNHDPYGNGSALEDPSGTGTDTAFNLRLPGQYYDQETGLMHNGWRDYDPTVGRYVESDPIGLYGGSWSTYSYANSNPVSEVDPLGEAGAVPVPGPAAPGLSLPDWLTIPAARTLGIIGLMLSLSGDTPQQQCPPQKPCPPCKTASGKIVLVGTIAYRPLDIPPPGTSQHGIEGPHHNLYKANQNPKNCQCFWQPIGAVSPSDLPAGAIPIEPFAN